MQVIIIYIIIQNYYYIVAGNKTSIIEPYKIAQSLIIVPGTKIIGRVYKLYIAVKIMIPVAMT